MIEPVLVVRDLRKAFGAQTVLDGIDLRVEAGSVFALLGPNGAGKTTLISILSTLVDPDGGTATGSRATPPRGRADARANCWRASTWPARRASASPPTPVGCAAGSTWR